MFCFVGDMIRGRILLFSGVLCLFVLPDFSVWMLRIWFDLLGFAGFCFICLWFRVGLTISFCWWIGTV